MMVEPEAPKRGDVLLGLVESLGRLAADSTTSIISRFEAIDLLLRLAIGPRHRGADGVDVTASRHARITLANVGWFLDQTMTSTDNRARIRLHAASLSRLVTTVAGRYW